MKSILLCVGAILFALQCASSQDATITLPLWPEGPPDTLNQSQREILENRPTEQNEVGLNRAYTGVSVPTVTVFQSKGGGEHLPAVVIFPGGGYNRVVIDKEGFDVARWLVQHNVAALVVKYRTAPPGVKARGPGADRAVQSYILSDALQAMRIARVHAEEWGIDTARIGVMGFSAGGHLAARLCVETTSDNAHPAFAALIYPALETDFESVSLRNAPPTFMVTACDDATAPTARCVAFADGLRRAGIAEEIQVYREGGHGFGLGVRGGEVVNWKFCFLEWLDEIEKRK
jgi:acetyl esterase/lipase